MRKKCLSIILSVLVLTTGCAATIEETGQQTEDLLSKEVSWKLDYEVPICTASVLVDREGYYTDREKKVCFRGEELGSTFDVVNADTKEVVYTGNITDKQIDQTNNESVSVGDFTEFTTPGTYYIQTDIVGQSYKFQISDEAYDVLFANMLENSIFYSLDEVAQKEIKDTTIKAADYEKQEKRKDVYEECMAITAQALAMTYYSTCFEQEDGSTLNVAKDMQQEASWLLSMQQDNGSVYAGLYIPEDNTICRAPESDAATAAFCGSMVILSKVFENSDSQMAINYREAAKRAFEALEQSKTVSDSAKFYAAAWLFWLDGDSNRQIYVTSYLQQQIPSIVEDRFALYGCLAYVSAEYKTDTTICASVMKAFMDSAEDTATQMKKQPYLVYSAKMEENFERMLIVSIANYVVPSNEYVTVLENFAHYLLGRNTNGYRYIDDDGCLVATTDAPEKTQQWDAIVRFMMCGILNAESDKKTK